MDITAFKDKELEIVGFDGAMVSDCGSALPIVHRVGTDIYFSRVSSTAPKLSRPVFSGREVDEFTEEGRITRIQPTRYSADALAVFVKPSISQALGHDFDAKGYDWQTLDNGVVVTCTDAASAYALLDSLAEMLMAKAETLLGPLTIGGAVEHDSADRKQVIEKATRLARIAVTTARDAGLRHHVCLRYGLAIRLSAEPRRLNNVYRFVVAKEYPKWSWEEYQRDISLVEFRLQQIYGTKKKQKADYGSGQGNLNVSEASGDLPPLYHPKDNRQSDTQGMSSQEEKVSEVYQEFRTNVEALEHTLRLSQRTNRDKRVIAAALARDFRRSHPLDQTTIIRGMRALQVCRGVMHTSPEVLTVLGSMPISYYSRALSVAGEESRLSKPALVKSLVRMHLHTNPTDVESVLLDLLTRRGTADRLRHMAYEPRVEKFNGPFALRTSRYRPWLRGPNKNARLNKSLPGRQHPKPIFVRASK